MKEKIHVAFALNDPYVPFLCNTLFSVVWNIKEGYEVEAHIVHSGISEKNKEILKKFFAKISNVSLSFVYVDMKKYVGFSVCNVSIEAYLKADLHNMLSDIKKIIYLDCDIVVNDDISELYSIPLDGNVVGAVREIITQNHYTNVLGISSNYGYFNNGMMLMDLELMRKYNINEKVSEFHKKNHKNLLAADQDCMNGALNNLWKVLNPKYNFTSQMVYGNNYKKFGYTKKEWKEARENPVIIHYLGPARPWNSYCLHPLRNLWWKYFNLTPFVKSFKKKNKIKFFIGNLALMIDAKMQHMFSFEVYNVIVGTFKKLCKGLFMKLRNFK